MDFLFISGDEKFLPWKKYRKFVILLKMCKITNKCIFASGIGAQIIVYFLATNYLTEINVINSGEEIKVLEEIHKIPKHFLENLKKNEFFLDGVSGDLYEYRQV